MASKWMKDPKRARDAIMLATLLAFETQRDPIGDSDLDDEQPITLTVTTRLGFVRKARTLYAGDATALVPTIHKDVDNNDRGREPATS